MPRMSRNIEVGGLYHVMNRGVEKRKIFMKKQDYSRFTLGLEFFNRKDAHTSLWHILASAGPNSMPKRLLLEREKPSEPLTELMAFVLMPNHYHFIVREIQVGGTAEFMKRMGGYSTYFNKQYDRVGTLFQGRYKSVAIKDDNQAKIAFVYVHANPVELVEPGWKDFDVRNPKNAVRYLSSYEWSSYADYAGEEPKYPMTIQSGYYRKLLGGPKKCRKVVEDRILAGSVPAKQRGH